MPSQDPSRHSQTDAVFVGFAGRIGAGKTSAAQYLSNKHGFQYTRYSQVLEEWLASEALGRKTLQEFGWEVMAGGRQVELNARLIARLDRSKSAAIDGLRHPIDFHCLSYVFGASFGLVFLDAVAGTRFKRKPRFSTYDEFQAADSQPVEANIGSLRPLATATLPTEGSAEDLHHRLDAWLKGFRMGERT